jgi:predicted phosphodiesterase
MTRRWASIIVVVALALMSACDEGGSSTTTPADAPVPTSTPQSSTTTTTSTPTSTGAAPTTTEAPSIDALVIGDFGDGSERERDVAAAMEAYAATSPVAALITTGDNLYTDDTQAAWFGPFGWIEDLGIPVYAAWGNHDEQSRSRKRAVASSLAPPGRWYAATIGDATLIVLDANDVANPQQQESLEATLAASGTGPVIVSFHQPAFSCSKHGSTGAVVASWVPLFERYGVDLVLNGHDHNYQRFDHNGVMYVVTGNGGRGLYAVGACPNGTPTPIVADDRTHGFVVLHIAADEIAVEALGTDGRRIDEFVVTDTP